MVKGKTVLSSQNLLLLYFFLPLPLNQENKNQKTKAKECSNSTLMVFKLYYPRLCKDFLLELLENKIETETSYMFPSGRQTPEIKQISTYI